MGHSWKLSVYATIAMGISVCGEEREEEEVERIEVLLVLHPCVGTGSYINELY